jgi:hypothetical protein
MRAAYVDSGGRKVSRGGILAAIIVALVALAGCGSGGGLSTPSPFAGEWGGVMGAAAGGVDSGMPTSVSLSVDRKGHLTGTWTDAGSSGLLSGEVNNSGTLTLSVASPSPSPDAVTGGVSRRLRAMVPGKDRSR